MELDNLSDIEQMLDGILQRRSGFAHATSPYDGFTDTEQDIHLHQKIEFVTPAEMISVLMPAVEGELVLQKEDTFFVELRMNFGVLQIKSVETGWSEEHPADQLSLSLTLDGIFSNNLPLLNKLSVKYASAAITEVNNKIVCSRNVILQGGRSVENLLWEFIRFTQTAERIYKELIFF